MPAIQRSFDDSLAGVIYWDSSFTIATLYERQGRHAECLAFRERCKRRQVLAVISDFVLDEMAFWSVKGSLVAEAQRTGQRWVDVKRQRPDVVRASLAEVAVKRSELETQALKLTIPDSVTDRAFQLMKDFALLPTDAYHIAADLESGVNAFVTLDEDFLAVDDIIVYTCLPERPRAS